MQAITLTLILLFNLPSLVLAGLPVAVDGEKLPTLAPMLEQVTPSVVNIATSSMVVQHSPLFNDPFFRHFFDVPQQRRERKKTGLGSGVIIDAQQGYIVTNNHVIEKADDIVVTLSDGRKLAATIIGRDPDADVAVIQVAAERLSAIKVADSNTLRVGDFVVAIGNPFGLGQTVTSGIVSALGRSGLGIEKYEDFIQTDASINPGNSGGALVNLRGELVGINTAIVGPNGGSVGIGFAIPFNMAQQIIEQLIEHGEVKRGRLGFTAQDLTPELAQAFGLEQSKGVVVARVEPKSAADKAGMVAGDVIVRVNGEEISRSSDVRNKIGLTRVGDAIQLEVIRNGKLKRLTARIAAQKVTSKAAEQFSSKLAGAEISLTEIEKTNGSAKSVLVISKLKPGSAAAYAGLRPGDIILSVNQQPVSDFASLEQAIKLETRGLLFNIQRGRRALFLIIQ
ncbi:MAG: DegQ family serine endoprotease [Candidatus Thioglobus sp.]|nr:MAG: DegQ family serine endoprotease [Candidatus Thioglobus sp.]|tara:strand:- start:2792 stop:4147 length:1356 start_codon:yes stop_codon:yes gene_type:complete